MSRQDIDIGIEGNDGTGDSIRESFRKTNENFQELYAVFGLGGQISITNLDDIPNSITPGALLLGNSTGTAYVTTVFGSNSDLDVGNEYYNDVDTIVIDTVTEPGKIILRSSFGNIQDDTSPALGAGLDAQNFAIAGVNVSESAVTDLNSAHATNYNIDDLVQSRKYADQRYAPADLPIRIADEPVDTSAYTKTITQYVNNNVYIASHGFERRQNGLPFVFSADFTAPTNLVDGTTYYIRYVNENEIALFTTESDAKSFDANALDNKILIGNGAVAVDDSHTLLDAAYDATLASNWLSTQSLPRKSVVVRQGDTMTGALYLHDHPGDLAGSSSSVDDLQAATKFYVDNIATPSTSVLYASPTGDDLQTNVPNGRNGSSVGYAFKTIQAAANYADELVKYSQEVPGPYKQTVSHSDFTTNSLVVTRGLVSENSTNANSVIDTNKKYLVAELKGFAEFAYPNYSFDELTFTADLTTLIDSIRFDVNKGNTANALTKRFAQKYYSSQEGRIKISSFLTENTAIVDKLYEMLNESIFENQGYKQRFIDSITKSVGNTPGVVTTSTNHNLVDGNIVRFFDIPGMHELEDTYAYVKVVSATTFELYADSGLNTIVDSSAYSDYEADSTLGKLELHYQQYHSQNKSGANVNSTEPAAIISIQSLIDLVKDIWTNGPDSGQDIVYGEKYIISVTADINGLVDQTDSANIDALPSKVIRGKSSGALGIITSFAADDPNNETDFYLNMLLPIDFYVDEEIELGYQSRAKEVSILVESGTYEEDYPVKLPQNTSLIGDEFRRVLVKPKARLSQSPHADVYFYRDSSFDSITLNSTGNIYTDQNGNQKGRLGNHYLQYPDRALNLGPAVTNAGSYTEAAHILTHNKNYLIEESIAFMNAANTDFGVTFNEAVFRADYDKLIIALINDLTFGGESNSLEIQSDYFLALDTDDPLTKFGDSSSERAVKASLENLSTIITNLFAGSASSATDAVYTSYTQGSTAVTNIVLPNTSETAEAGATAAMQALITKINFVFDGVTPEGGGAFGATNFNPPKLNKYIDAFLLNDGCTMENITIQEHESFGVVLDPDGQILTRSPYIANCSNIIQSTNTKSFAGGAYIDSFAGNIPITIRGNSGVFTDETGSVSLSSTVLWIESSDYDVLGDSTITTAQGLKLREPQLPSVFYVDGVRYQVNAFSNYDQGLGRCVVYLDSSTPYAGAVDVDTAIQAGGTRTVVINNFAQINDLGYGIVANNGAQINVSDTEATYNQAAFYSKDGSIVNVGNSTATFGKFGLVAEGADPNIIPDAVTLLDNMIQPAKVYTTYLGNNTETSVKIYDVVSAPKEGGILTIATQNGDSSDTAYNYKIDTVTQTGDTGGNPDISATVYELFLEADDISSSDFYGALQTALATDQLVEIRDSRQFIFDGVASPSTLNIKPNTTITFTESTNTAYSSELFATTDNYANNLTATQTRTQFDKGFDYIELIPSVANTNSGRGDAVGDTTLAIEVLTADDQARIAAGGVIFVWAGKTHEITSNSYTDFTTYATIDFTDIGTDLHAPNPAPGAGLAQSVNENQPNTLYAGLKAAAPASITEKTAILNSVGTKFSKVGAGSFNDSNFPNLILGDPVDNSDPTTFTDSPAATKGEVWERTQGRVFWTSTDQFGVFRVGQFFNIDQATGTTTISSGIGLTNATALGFTTGTTITEFSVDDGFVDNSDDAVPTEKAIRRYIDRRLGLDQTGASVTPSERLPATTGGFLPLAGGVPLTANLDMGGFRIEDLGSPAAGNNAANKDYVDTTVGTRDSFFKLADTDINSTVALADNHHMIYDSTLSAWVNAPYDTDVANSDFVVTFNGTSNKLEGQIAAGAIVNADISASAAIDQSKLNLADATTTTKGIASFAAAHFTVTAGAVDISANSIAKTDLEQIATNSVLGRTTAGTGDVEAVTITDLLTAGNAIVDGDFGAYNSGLEVLTRTAAATYGIEKAIDEGTDANSLVRRNASGTIRASSYVIGGNQTYEILSLSGTTLNLKTPDQGVIFTAQGSSKPTINTGGVIRVGDIGAYSESVFHAASSFGTGQASEETSALAARWIYSSFIEAPDEKDASSTGIAIGAGTVTDSAADTIVLVANGATKLKVNNTDVETANKLSVTNSTASTNTTTGALVVTGGAGIGGALNVGSTITAATGLTVTDGDITMDTSATTDTLYTRSISTSGDAVTGLMTGNWSLVGSSRFEATYADLAEYYEADAEYEVGTVMILGGEKEVTQSTEHNTNKIAGVISNTAAFTMNQDCPGIAACIALVGRIPVKVIGKVSKGDMLVASAIPGYAIVEKDPKIGTVLGKAIEDKNNDGKGLIEVLVGKL
jgi:hypothetical protein